MLRALALRTSVLVFSALLASMVLFAVLWALPGDPAQVALGLSAKPADVARLRAEFGLDRPVIAQYLDWLGGVLHGDFGLSLRSRAPITGVLLDRFSVTLWLVAGGIVIALAIAIPLGTLAAATHRRKLGSVVSGLSQIGVALPAFLVGMLLVYVFAVWLGWFAPNGYVVPGQNFGEFLRHMTLPWLSLGLVQGAVLTRYVRSAVLDEISKDYLRTVRAKGRTRTGALIRHGLRNASIPVVTVLGVQLVTLMVGAVVIERVFVIPGIGDMLTTAVEMRDLTSVQAIVFVLVLFALVVGFVIDVAYAVIDPRLRAQ